MTSCRSRRPFPTSPLPLPFTHPFPPSLSLSLYVCACTGTVGPQNPCVFSIATDYLAGFGTRAANLTCLARMQPPDFEGTSAETQTAAADFFGTKNVWND